MPVTAKLSRKFYEKLGDDVTNELVEWFNLVDATYRSDLRELNELNFARFEAKLEQRIAELRAEMQAGFARVDTKLEERTAELRGEMQAGFAPADAKITGGFRAGRSAARRVRDSAHEADVELLDRPSRDHRRVGVPGGEDDEGLRSYSHTERTW